MYFGTMDEKHQYLQREAAQHRAAAAMIPALKKLVNAFDHKMYNCRFDNAIKELSNDDCRLYAYERYGWFYIEFGGSCFNGKNISLLSAYGVKKEGRERARAEERYFVFDDNKRIHSDKMINLLNESYSALLKEAAALDDASKNLEIICSQVADLTKKINQITESLPSAARHVCNFSKLY